MVVQRDEPVAQRAADHLVHRVVAPDVLAHEQQLAAAVEQPRGVQAAGAREGRLAQPVGQRGEQLARDRRAGGQRLGVDGDLLERALAADPARGGRVERARRRASRSSGPATSTMLAASSAAARPRAGRVDQPLAVQEAERELLVVAGRAHRHRERRAVDADLERLLDRDLVLDPRAAHRGVGAADADLGHAGGEQRAALEPVGERLQREVVADVERSRARVSSTSSSAACSAWASRLGVRRSASRRSVWRHELLGVGGDAGEVAVPEADELERVVERAGLGAPRGAPGALA